MKKTFIIVLLLAFGIGLLSFQTTLAVTFAEGTPADGKVGEVGNWCNYDKETKDGKSVQHITCDSTKELVCSDNDANTSSYNVCLKMMGSTCAETAECEAGAICENKKCVLDTYASAFQGTLGSDARDIRDSIRKFINIILGFLGVLTVMFIIYGGVMWLTAAGSEEKVEKGKQTLLWAAIGAIVISIAWTIASYVLKIGQTVG